MQSRVHPIFGNASSGSTYSTHDAVYAASTTIAEPVEWKQHDRHTGVETADRRTYPGARDADPERRCVHCRQRSTQRVLRHWGRVSTVAADRTKGGVYGGAAPVAFGYATADVTSLRLEKRRQRGAGSGGAGQTPATWSTVAGWTPTASGILMAPPGFWLVRSIPQSQPDSARLSPAPTGWRYGWRGWRTRRRRWERRGWRARRWVIWIAAGMSSSVVRRSSARRAPRAIFRRPNAGGGGGGGGGVIILIYETITGASYFSDFANVAAGCRHGSGVTTAGSSGKVFEILVKAYL